MPSDQAYCIYKGKKVMIGNPGDFVTVKLSKKNPVRVVCSSSSFFVTYLKKGEQAKDAKPFTRVSPSVNSDFCTYTHPSNVTKIAKLKSNGTCPTNDEIAKTPPVKKKAKFKAHYFYNGKTDVAIKAGQPYTQFYELSLPTGEPMSPEECAGQVGIGHDDPSIPVRQYSIRYNTKTKTCTYQNNVNDKDFLKNLSAKRDVLHLHFPGNSYIDPADTDLVVNRY